MIPNHEMSGYSKSCYWLDPKELENIGSSLRQGESSPVEETRIPCRVLRTSMEIGLVSPPAWDGFCKRRTAWYWTSKKAGKFLVVSKRPLHISGLEEGTLITESNFKPDRLPTFDEVKTLAKSSAFQRSKPGMWDKIDPGEKDFYRRWFERYGAADPFDFERMFIFHSANHANFLDVRFFIPVENGVVPYSIADSLHTCSSCLEFFNVLGGQWPLKYVMPCLGAVQFARLPQDRYLKVVSLQWAEKVPPKD